MKSRQVIFCQCNYEYVLYISLRLLDTHNYVAMLLLFQIVKDGLLYSEIQITPRPK